MPGFNQTGPMGEGPMTGRKMGKCTNFGAKLKEQKTAENENLNQNMDENTNVGGLGLGRGRGLGFGRGRGRCGRGMGRQNRFDNGA